MLDYIHDNFTVNVTAEDIAAPNRGSWWDDPIRRAVMRQFRLAYPINVLVGWGYANITFPNEVDKFDVLPTQEVSDYLRAYQNGWEIKPATFTFQLVQIVAQKPESTKPTPKRFRNTPEPVARSGM